MLVTKPFPCRCARDLQRFPGAVAQLEVSFADLEKSAVTMMRLISVLLRLHLSQHALPLDLREHQRGMEPWYPEVQVIDVS
jgi:hypothetical protein